jgi:hypothetical protein
MNTTEDKGEVVSVLNYAPRETDVWGNAGTAPPFSISALDEREWSASRPNRFNLGERAAGTTGYEAGWAPDPVWT